MNDKVYKLLNLENHAEELFFPLSFFVNLS